MRKIVATKDAPAAIGPYAQANIIDNLVITSGQIPLIPETGEIVSGGIEEQTKQVLTNLEAVLKEAGTCLNNVVKTTCFIKDMNDFGKLNEVYGSFFTSGVYPSRSAIEVARLPKDVLVEIEAIAIIK